MKKLLIASIALFPLVSFAEEKTLKDIVGLVIEYLNIAIYLIIGLAIITFIWSVYLYFFTEKDKKDAGMYVLYSVIGFFVILSFWGLVAILRNSLDLNDRAPSFPGFNRLGSSGSSNSAPDQYWNDRYSHNPFNTNASNPSPSVTLPGGSNSGSIQLPGGSNQ